jgi:hypothetical protein
MFFTGLLIALNIRKRKSKSFDRVDNLILIWKIIMKTLNLTSYGVEEIKEVEMSEIDGGHPIILLLIGACAAVFAVGSLGLDMAYNIGYYEAAKSK